MKRNYNRNLANGTKQTRWPDNEPEQLPARLLGNLKKGMELELISAATKAMHCKAQRKTRDIFANTNRKRGSSCKEEHGRRQAARSRARIEETPIADHANSLQSALAGFLLGAR